MHIPLNSQDTLPNTPLREEEDEDSSLETNYLLESIATTLGLNSQHSFYTEDSFPSCSFQVTQECRLRSPKHHNLMSKFLENETSFENLKQASSFLVNECDLTNIVQENDSFLSVNNPEQEISFLETDGNLLKKGESFFEMDGNLLKEEESLFEIDGNLLKEEKSLFEMSGNLLKVEESLFEMDGNLLKKEESLFEMDDNLMKEEEFFFETDKNLLKEKESFFETDSNLLKEVKSFFETDDKLLKERESFFETDGNLQKEGESFFETDVHFRESNYTAGMPFFPGVVDNVNTESEMFDAAILQKKLPDLTGTNSDELALVRCSEPNQTPSR